MSVPRDAIQTILSNGLHAPSAGFSQGWGFLVLDDPSDVARFRDAATPDEDKEDWFAATFEARPPRAPARNLDEPPSIGSWSAVAGTTVAPS